MRQLTCREIDGICDTPISGVTLEELLNNRMRHLVESAEIFPEHQVVLNNLPLLSEDELARWNVQLTEKWNKAKEF